MHCEQNPVVKNHEILLTLHVSYHLYHRYYGLLLWFPEYFKCIHEKQMNCAFDLSHPDTCVPPGAVLQCNETGSIYVDSLYTSLATIPGTILGIITVNVLGGKVMLGEGVASGRS